MVRLLMARVVFNMFINWFTVSFRCIRTLVYPEPPPASRSGLPRDWSSRDVQLTRFTGTELMAFGLHKSHTRQYTDLVRP